MDDESFNVGDCVEFNAWYLLTPANKRATAYHNTRPLYGRVVATTATLYKVQLYATTVVANHVVDLTTPWALGVVETFAIGNLLDGVLSIPKRYVYSNDSTYEVVSAGQYTFCTRMN